MALAAYFVLALFSLLALVGISIHADRSLPPSADLPMQWGFDGRATWSAPRRIALGFTPVPFLLVALAMAFLVPPDWQADTLAMLGVFTGVAAALVGCHLFHIWLIRRGGWGRGT